ncbi:MAG: endonuclease/exonuclease/phosphatase family protein [Planctomycetota bacterium]
MDVPATPPSDNDATLAPARRLPARLGSAIDRLAGIACIGLIAATIACLAARASWLMALACHFRVQYVLVACALLIYAGLRRHRTSLVMGGAVTCALVLHLFVYVQAAWPARETPATGPTLRLLLHNVYIGNRQRSAAVDQARAAAADVAIFLEVDQAWIAELDTLALPHRLRIPRSDGFGIAVYSRHRILEHDTWHLGDDGIPTLHLRLEVDGVTCTLIATHPLPPVGAAYAQARNAHLRALAAHLHATDGPVVVAGDLNTTPYAPAYRDLLGTTDLRNAAAGRGHPPTWHANTPLALPLDHILVTPSIAVVTHRVLAACGSDHRAVQVELRLGQRPDRIGRWRRVRPTHSRRWRRPPCSRNPRHGHYRGRCEASRPGA